MSTLGGSNRIVRNPPGEERRTGIWTALRLRASAAMLAVLGGCAVGPDFQRPTPPQTERYTRDALPAATAVADGRAQRFATGTALTADWWQLFKSPSLDAVVRQALASNPTLEASVASLHQSQHNLRAGYGVFFPQLGAQAAAVRERTAPAQDGLKTPGSVFNVVTLGGTVGYALDLFGGERRAVEGLQAQADYQRYLTEAAYVSLTANVVNACVARAAYRAEVQATEQLLALQNQQLRTTQVQITAGTAAYADVLNLESLIAANEATLAPLKQRISQTEDLLATLEGVVPSQVSLPDIDLNSLSLPQDLPLSVPSDLVRQRPDVLASEMQLHAASAAIGVATAAMLPSITLSGDYGAAGPRLNALSVASGRFWDIGPSATIPLFQGGRLWNGRKAAIDAYQASQASYRQTVLDAFAQVGDSLQALQHDAEALQAQADSQHAAAEALKLVQVSYRAGLVAYLDVWTADVQYHQASIAYLQAVAQRYQDTVALFVALGGGWWTAPQLTESQGPP